MTTNAAPSVASWPATGEAGTQNEALTESDDGFEIRPVVPSDRAALMAFYAALSSDSRERRFLAARQGITDAEAVTYASADHEHREGLVAVARDGSILAHLCLEPGGPGHAEFGIAVADPFQHHHIGLTLLRAGVVWAQDHAIRTLDATARVDNEPMLALARSLGVPMTTGAGSAGVMSLSLDLSPRR